MIRSHPRWRLTRLAIVALCCLGLLFVVWQGVRLGLALRAAYTNGTNFAQLARADNLDAAGFAQAQSSLQAAAQALADADETMSFFAPSLKGLAWLPFYGPTLASLPPLVQAAHELSELAVTGFALGEPLLVGPATLSNLPQVLTRNQAQLATMTEQARRIEQTLAPISPDYLLTGLADAVADLQTLVRWLAAGLRLSDDLPVLLGTDQMRTYLVLVQNNHELRGTGGFITSVGELSLIQGKVVDFSFVDSYAIDAQLGQYPRAPAPMQRYMNIEMLMLRDVNWSPDLPTTAQIARSLYAQETGRTVDGVITIDLRAVELVIGALEPLSMPGSDIALTGATVIEQIKQMWAAPLQTDATLINNLVVDSSAEAASATGVADDNPNSWWEQRKNFIPQMAAAAFARLQGGSFDSMRMAHAVQTALDERALQIWSTQPSITAELAGLGWDGGLHPDPSRDFLALVDTNMGYNKADAVVERALTYQLEWPAGPGTPAVATATVTYQHALTTPAADCDPRPHYGTNYDAMMARCYFNYVRLFVPTGSELLAIDGVDPASTVSQRGEQNTTLFGAYFILQPGETKNVVFHYRLPAFVQAQGYELLIQKQAGTQPLPFSANFAGHIESTILQLGRSEWRPVGE